MSLRVVYAASCDCVPGRPMVDGRLPYYFADARTAIARYALEREAARTADPPHYYAVHVDGRHILKVMGG